MSRKQQNRGRCMQWLIIGGGVALIVILYLWANGSFSDLTYEQRMVRDNILDDAAGAPVRILDWFPPEPVSSEAKKEWGTLMNWGDQAIVALRVQFEVRGPWPADEPTPTGSHSSVQLSDSEGWHRLDKVWLMPRRGKPYVLVDGIEYADFVHPVDATQPAVPRPDFDETKGFWHKPSGVGFVYPDGWVHLPPRRGEGTTSIGLLKPTPAVDVSIYWTKYPLPIDDKNVGDAEYQSQTLHRGNKVTKPQAVKSGKQPGYKLSVTGDFLGTGSEIHGVIYVFAVRQTGRYWMIKVFGTAREQQQLVVVEELLQQYRWLRTTTGEKAMH